MNNDNKNVFESQMSLIVFSFKTTQHGKYIRETFSSVCR